MMLKPFIPLRFSGSSFYMSCKKYNTKSFLFQYLYAFNITPLARMEPLELTAQPQDVTETPYKPKTFVHVQTDKQASIWSFSASSVKT